MVITHEIYRLRLVNLPVWASEVEARRKSRKAKRVPDSILHEIPHQQQQLWAESLDEWNRSNWQPSAEPSMMNKLNLISWRQFNETLTSKITTCKFFRILTQNGFIALEKQLNLLLFWNIFCMWSKLALLIPVRKFIPTSKRKIFSVNN